MNTESKVKKAKDKIVRVIRKEKERGNIARDIERINHDRKR